MFRRRLSGEQRALLRDVTEQHIEGLEESIAAMTNDRTLQNVNTLTELCGEASDEIRQLRCIQELLA